VQAGLQRDLDSGINSRHGNIRRIMMYHILHWWYTYMQYVPDTRRVGMGSRKVRLSSIPRLERIGYVAVKDSLRRLRRP
jgi:hypothetical protein